MDNKVKDILKRYDEKDRLMDIFHDIQKEYGYIDDYRIKEIARYFDISSVDVLQALSFYHFFKYKKSAKFSIYLNEGIVAKMYGRDKIAKAFENATKTKFGTISKDGLFGLYNTSDIGMGDQEPAAIINNVIFPKITTYRVREIIKEFKKGKCPEDLINSFGDGHNQDPLIKSMVANNLNRRGRVIFSGVEYSDSLNKLKGISPDEVIEIIKDSNIRGRGGAGFPVGIKWQYCKNAKGKEKYIICNADEGEPGTFKDRVILTERPKGIFTGMAIAGYAVGAKQGVIYLRKEYQYLVNYLENQLKESRDEGILGKNINGIDGFDFDIRIQLGAGAYICGLASALLESMEGKRGEPRPKMYHLVERGYKDMPTVVNNVESLCAIPKIICEGSKWYKAMGTSQSSGTTLLSISGDVMYPGVFEVEYGITLREVLEMAGAYNSFAVQVGGPSGKLVAKNEFHRKIAFEDLGSGGSIIVFNKTRNILDIVKTFTEFFVEESCGACTPCRNMTKILDNKLQKIIDGKGIDKDLDDMIEWGNHLKIASRCGLGKTAANPILYSLSNFRNEYEAIISKGKDFETTFDIQKAILKGAKAVSRFPEVPTEH